MEQKITTIKLSKYNKNRLENFRIYKRETYDEIIVKILDILNTCRISPNHARMKLISIDRQKREEIK